ncbi:MAG TPA: hypothetical protein VNF51_02790 [Candidatus Paceibacterota bacterium]|nr:hypothetical protein [Candidatus Paceibacterota bacterium]
MKKGKREVSIVGYDGIHSAIVDEEWVKEITKEVVPTTSEIPLERLVVEVGAIILIVGMIVVMTN